MVTLGDFDKKREENFINTLEVIKEVISKDDGTLKIIVSDLSKRLFLKMGEDGLLEKDAALVDLEQAKKVYLEKKKIEGSPRILFIFSPIVRSCFGDEEMYNMAKFIEMIGENAQKVLVFDLKDGNHPEYGFNDISASLSFFAAKCNGASTFLNDTIDFRTRTIKGNFKLIDLIRYILGIYEIKNKQVIITTPEIYPKINNKELAFSLLDQHYKIMEKEQRFIDPRKFFSGFGAHRGDIKYLTSSFSKTSLDITKLGNVGKTDLDTLAKWGMLTLDNEGLYHVNYETYGILPFILDFDTRLKYIYESIYKIFRFRISWGSFE